MGNGKTWKSDRFFKPTLIPNCGPSTRTLFVEGSVPRAALAHKPAPIRGPCRLYREEGAWAGMPDKLFSGEAFFSPSLLECLVLHVPFVCVNQAGTPPAGAVSDVALLVSHSAAWSEVVMVRGAVEAFVRQAAHHLRLWVVKSELGKERRGRNFVSGCIWSDGFVKASMAFSRDPGKNGTPLSLPSSKPATGHTQHFDSVIGLPTAAAAILPSPPTHGCTRRSRQIPSQPNQGPP